MARKYQLKQRAERQQETRQRIVEAAVALHTSVGPARTTVSEIARKARVQRHTFYRHFPDERTLWLACSGLYAEQHPFPDVRPLKEIGDPEARLRKGLSDLYQYYEANAAALIPLIRDAETHDLTREIMQLRFRSTFDELRAALAAGFRERAHAGRRIAGVLGTFLEFSVWRSLMAGVGSSADAVDAAVLAIMAQRRA